MKIAIVPTVYGIETNNCWFSFTLRKTTKIAIVPTVYGIETPSYGDVLLVN